MRGRAVIIARRFCGPPDSGNGGYSAGLLASALGGGAAGAVEVTLRRPPPLERELAVTVSGEHAELRDGELLVAEARLTSLEVELPAPLGFERATELSKHYIGYQKHHFPGCFVCGPGRAVGDGLRIFPGHEQDAQPMAAPWVPDVSIADERGVVPAEQRWAALDCIGYFASGAPDYPVALLGRMTAELSGEVRAGERYVVRGALLAREGRKLHAATALYDESGALSGRARQTWILLA
jgi:hypothetical protein